MHDCERGGIVDLVEHSLDGFLNAESIDLVGTQIVGNVSHFGDRSRTEIVSLSILSVKGNDGKLGMGRNTYGF